jgi:hypothetical protein
LAGSSGVRSLVLTVEEGKPIFKGQYFYHEHIKKAVIAFGTIFNDIRIHRESDSDDRSQNIKVPLSYGPKQKWLARLRDVPTLEEGRARVEITLPRMGFEITSVSYDSARKLPQVQQVVRENRTAYVSTPYDIGFALFVMARNQSDGLQIVEQILPYFCPDFNVTVKEIPELDPKYTRDWKLVLDSTTYSEDYEGSFDDKSIMLWELAFTLKVNLWGPVQNATRIRKVIENIYANLPGEVNDDTYHETIVTQPWPLDAQYGDDYSFLQEFLRGTGDLSGDT